LAGHKNSLVVCCFRAFSHTVSRSGISVWKKADKHQPDVGLLYSPCALRIAGSPTNFPGDPVKNTRAGALQEATSSPEC
jgi:hypothetical protein